MLASTRLKRLLSPVIVPIFGHHLEPIQILLPASFLLKFAVLTSHFPMFQCARGNLSLCPTFGWVGVPLPLL